MTIELKNTYKLLEDVLNDSIATYDLFRNNIFHDIDYYAIESLVPMWIRDAGNSAESAISKDIFERLVKANDNILTHKFLYYYDCDILLSSLRDRFSIINSLIGKFYEKMPVKSKCEMAEYTSAIMNISSMDVEVFAYLNSIFIFLGSSFDILTKVATELSNIKSVDYSVYPNLKSKNVLFGNFKYIIPELLIDTIFERTEIIRKVETIRNRIDHNGSFDFNQVIYTGYIENDDTYESCIMFPDFNGSNFASYKNRGNFHSEATRINIDLPILLVECVELIKNTITKLNEKFDKVRYSNINDIIEYKDDINNWSKTGYDVLSKCVGQTTK